MQTHGPVVVDAFHRKFLLQRPRDLAERASAQSLMQMLKLREAEVRREPNRVEHRDGLVCTLIRVNGTLYEDVMGVMATLRPGDDTTFVDQGFALLQGATEQALDHLDVMPRLMLGDMSAPRISALRAGLGHNMAVSLLERGMIAEGRDTARESLEILRQGQSPGRPEALAETIEPRLVELAA